MSAARLIPPLADHSPSLGDAVRTAAARCSLTAFPDLLSLVLGGSLATGEATWQHTETAWVLLSDIDLLAIFPVRRRLPTALELRTLQKSITDTLAAQGLLCHATVRAGHPAGLRRLAGTIFAFELRTQGQVLAGDGGVLRRALDGATADISREDAWRLLTNRMVELVGWLAASNIAPDPPPRDAYPLLKLQLGMAASLLVFAGRFAPTYRGRLQALTHLAAQPPAGFIWPCDPGGFLAIIANATRTKLGGGTDSPSHSPPAEGGDASAAETWRRTLRHLHRLWRWELAQLLGLGDFTDLADLALLRGWAGRQRWPQRGRAWAALLRRIPLCAWPRELALWFTRAAPLTPRFWIYAVAAQLLFGPAPPAVETRPTGVMGRGRLRQREDWRAAAVAVAGSYHRFLEDSCA